MLQGYSSFRQGVLDDYDKFLDGVWKEYQQFKAVERDTVPKPQVAPKAQPEPERKPWIMKQPEPSVEAPKPRPVETPKSQPATPPQPSAPVVPSAGSADFDFYGMTVSLPAVKVELPSDMKQTAAFASAWRTLDKSDIRRNLIPALKSAAAGMGLNDYLTSELADSYIKGTLPQLGVNASLAMRHYILANMGYDVRIGVSSAGDAVLLMPFEQSQVFGRAYLTIDGKRYYMFFGGDFPPEAGATVPVYTCELPSDADLGKKFDLRVGPLNLPYKARKYHLSAAGIDVSGEFNANVLRLLYRYPQMPMGEYAMSEVLPDVRASFVAQVKEQLAGRPQIEAVDSLLQFVQSAFDYATDGDFHGFEKPNFFEETLFYDKCDCEDRAILYTYLLWHALGLRCQLLYFPGHESAAVALSEPIKGDSYTHEGVTYYISDPTYIGSVTGMCMPNYRSTQPRVDFTYGGK